LARLKFNRANFIVVISSAAVLVMLAACGISPERAEIFESTSRQDGSPIIETVAEPQQSTEAVITPLETAEPVLSTNADDSPTAPALENAFDATEFETAADDPRAERLDAYLTELAQSGRFMGTVLIADSGEVILNEGYGSADISAGIENRPQTQLRIGSITKQFTAAAVLRLQELGKLQVSDPISVYLPDFPGGESITIHQLLTHTAGVPNYTRRPDLEQVIQTPIALDDLVAQIAGQPLEFSPGRQFAYSDSGYVILTKIIEVAASQPYESVVKSLFFDQAGMSRSGYDFLAPDLIEPAVGYQLTPGGPRQAVNTDSSWPSGAGALYSTTEDLYRWDRALKGNQLLQDPSLEAMFTPWIDTGQGFAYGYGWEIGQVAGHPAQTHAGTVPGFASFIARFPEDDAAVIILSNGIQMSPRQLAAELSQILFAPSGP
jgi:CubicO group peptidase (beta-lactamase class C family)